MRPMARGEMLTAFCLTEPQSGSDAGAIRTRAERRNGDATCSTARSSSSPRARTPMSRWSSPPPIPRRQARHQLLHRRHQAARLSRRPHRKKMGQNASDTCEIQLESVSVPAENRLGAEGQGYRIALANLEGGRIGIAAQAVGMARAALRDRRRLCAGAPQLRQDDLRASSRRRSGWPTWRPSSKRRGSSCCMPPPCAARAAVPQARPRWRSCSPPKRPSASARTPSRRWAAPAICRLRRRAHLSRGARRQDLRGHQRHPAPGHQPRAGRPIGAGKAQLMFTTATTDGVTTLTLNRPPVNAISEEWVAAFEAKLDELARGPRLYRPAYPVGAEGVLRRRRS